MKLGRRKVLADGASIKSIKFINRIMYYFAKAIIVEL